MEKADKLLEWVAMRDYMWRFCGVPDEYESEWVRECECIKQSCRDFAREILSHLDLYITTERELPIRFLHPDDKPNTSYSKAQQDMLRAGYLPIISLKACIIKRGK